MLKNIILTGVVAGLSFTLLLLAILPFVAGKEFRNIFPTFQPVSEESSAATAVVAKVSTNGISYFDSVTTTKKIGYYMKINLNYTGPMEAMLDGKVFKWLDVTNGVKRVTPELLTGVAAGIYPARFRPLVTSGINPYAWSNQVIVLQQNEVNAALTPGFKTEVSVDGKNYSPSIVTTREKGYYLRVIPAYTGPMEAMLDGKVFKWHDLINGVKRVTAAELAGAKDGTYVAKFRPYTTATTNPYPWGSAITVVQNPSLGGKSTKLACTGLAQPNVTKMLNVGTWNVGGIGGSAGNDAELDKKAVAVGQKMKAFGLDVVIVQEVHKYRQSTNYSDSVTKTNFMKLVQAQVPEKLYFYAQFQPGSEHSLVTVSKFPIIASGYKDLRGSRKITYALIDSPAGRLKVFNTHLQRKDANMCPGMDVAVDFIKSKLVSGDKYIVGGDFNAQYDPSRGFWEYDGGGKRYCTYDQSFTQIFAMNCTTSPCVYTPNTIDFILGGTASKPAVYQYCMKESYGLVDSHALYLSTVTL